jgi:hypothetical protein
MIEDAAEYLTTVEPLRTLLDDNLGTPQPPPTAAATGWPLLLISPLASSHATS